MLKDEIIDFFQTVLPFDRLSREALEEMLSDIAMEYYPKGEIILQENGPPSDFLGVIKKGGVKISHSSDNAEEVILDLRGEGEHFGMLSLISSDRSRSNVVSIEDTICYQVPKERVLAILKDNPSVNEYFLKSFFVNLIDKTYEESRKRYTGGTTGEQLLFSTKVKDVVRTSPRTVSPETSIQEAAADMATHKISSLVVVGPDNAPVGMVTDRDFREKVVALGRSVEEPISTIMNVPLITIDSEDNCFEALLKMIREGIHHILVLEGEKLTGMMTNHDFMLMQGSSPTILVKEIDSIKSIDQLQDTAPKFYKAVSSLLRHGARPNNITGLITELTEKITNSVVDIFENENGPAPLDYSLFFLGEAGRRELTLSFRVNMGIVYSDPTSSEERLIADTYFKRLAEALNSSLHSCELTGKKKCLSAENISESSAWHKKLSSWGTAAGTGQDTGLFDMRAVRGDNDRVDELRFYIIKRASQYKDMMEAIAAYTLQVRPPLGFFKDFVVEKDGEHINELDLFEKGIKPLVDSAKIFSLEKGVKSLSTPARLQELKTRHDFKVADDMSQALEYLTGLLINAQLRKVEDNLRPDNFINPDELTTFERKTLKESFQLTARLYDQIEGNYWSGKVLP